LRSAWQVATTRDTLRDARQPPGLRTGGPVAASTNAMKRVAGCIRQA